ncbi:g3167 [Coccomyxa elongata]
MVSIAALIPIVIGLFGAAIVIPWDKTIITEPLPRNTTATENCGLINDPKYRRRTVFFPSKGLQLEGWLYTPKGVEGRPPIVVLAHGIAGQKDMGLHPFAEVFAQRGLAVLTFDYRNFGGSDGEPRNWVSPKRHLEDWEAALDYVRSTLGAEVDVTRIGLWGTSFAGGHVLVTAAKEGGNISAVVSQVPHLSGFEVSKQSLKSRGVPQSVRLFLAGLHDRARDLVGLPPAYLKVAGPPGSNSFMELNDADMQLYLAKHPEHYMGGWQNRVLARLANEMSRYNPIHYVPKIKAPVLLVATMKDTLCPIAVAHRAAELNSNIQLLEKDVGHFDVYLGDLFDEVSVAQARFLVEKLGAVVPVHEAAEALPLL